MLIGVVKEQLANEARVAATPKTIEQLLKLGFSVIVETGAGLKSSFDDNALIAAGASIGETNEVWASDIVLKINQPTEDEIAKLKDGATLISFIQPALHPELMQQLSQKKINVLAVDCVPRISRAQSMDVLSSMANIAGYRAVIEAAHQFGSFFTGQITAAGKVPPAKVLVIGAGVAGLAAIGAARSLGAIVKAFDSRPEVKEQVESMGAQFLEIDHKEEGGSGDGYAKVMSEEFNRKALALYAEQAKDVDIIITTALIPGKPAPLLIPEDVVATMKPGSVIVDLAAANGGNCELAIAGDIILTENRVKIIGYTDLPSRLPTQASQLYGTNLVNLLKLLCKEKDGNIDLNFEDVIIRGVTVIKEGEITWPAPPIQVSAQPQQAKAQPTKVEPVESKPISPVFKYGMLFVALFAFLFLANSAPAAFLEHLVVFALSCVAGYYVVWNVSHALHTPLMAVTNAISGIIVVGAILQISSESLAVRILAFIAVLIASINIFGGFKVTQRMLQMFRKN